MGRLVSDPEVRYANNAEQTAVAKFHLAVNRRVHRDNEKNADFIPCIAFGKLGEFCERYLSKGIQISLIGRMQVRSWDDNDGSRRWSTEVIAEEVFFADSKKEEKETGFYPIDESIEDDDLPF